MPQGDMTGPMGAGPGTGRGLGSCRLGLGWRREFVSKEMLVNYKRALLEELEDVEKKEKELG